MLSVLTTTLGVSIVMMVLLLVVKRYEMKRHRVVFHRLRPRVNRFFQGILVFVEHILPGAGKNLVHRFVRGVRGVVERLVARAILVFEFTLEHVLHTVRQKSQVKEGGGEVSLFLREVAAHKQKLLKRARSQRAIFEE